MREFESLPFGLAIDSVGRPVICQIFIRISSFASAGTDINSIVAGKRQAHGPVCNCVIRGLASFAVIHVHYSALPLPLGKRFA